MDDVYIQSDTNSMSVCGIQIEGQNGSTDDDGLFYKLTE
jgi:hypothetical protein